MSPSRYGEASSSNDPVTQLFDVFRQGTPLCELYNLLEPATRLPTDVGDAVNSTNACKKLVARFIIAMQSEMGFDPDEMFTVMQVYRENTNDWVQVSRRAKDGDATDQLIPSLRAAGPSCRWQVTRQA